MSELCLCCEHSGYVMPVEEEEAACVNCGHPFEQHVELTRLLQRPPGAELLTEVEHEAIDMAGRLWTLIRTEVIGHGPTRVSDVSELTAFIHGIQHIVMAQAAARAYPDRYRLQGGLITPTALRGAKAGEFDRQGE